MLHNISLNFHDKYLIRSNFYRFMKKALVPRACLGSWQFNKSVFQFEAVAEHVASLPIAKRLTGQRCFSQLKAVIPLPPANVANNCVAHKLISLVHNKSALYPARALEPCCISHATLIYIPAGGFIWERFAGFVNRTVSKKTIGYNFLYSIELSQKNPKLCLSYMIQEQIKSILSYQRELCISEKSVSSKQILRLLIVTGSRRNWILIRICYLLVRLPLWVQALSRFLTRPKAGISYDKKRNKKKTLCVQQMFLFR